MLKSKEEIESFNIQYIDDSSLLDKVLQLSRISAEKNALQFPIDNNLENNLKIGIDEIKRRLFESPHYFRLSDEREYKRGVIESVKKFINEENNYFLPMDKFRSQLLAKLNEYEKSK